MYIAHAVKWNHLHYKESDVFTNVAIQRIVDENNVLIQDIIAQLPLWQRIFLNPIVKKRNPVHYSPDYLYREAQKNETVMKVFKDDNFTSGTILEDWENVSDSELVKQLINVGEYKTYRKDSI